jgi:hypothetical protein
VRREGRKRTTSSEGENERERERKKRAKESGDELNKERGNRKEGMGGVQSPHHCT